MMTDFAFCKFVFNNVVKTYYSGLCSHGNDIVPLSYRFDFWNGIVDCVYTDSVYYRTSFLDNILKQGVGKGKSCP